MYSKDHNAQEKDSLESRGFLSLGSSSVIKGLNTGDPDYIIPQITWIPILSFTKKIVKNLSDSENALPCSHIFYPPTKRSV